jgi:hypothetical protein
MKMRILNTKVHGIIDYMMVIFLVASPWILGFTKHPAAKLISPTIAAAIFFLAICTKFELGIIKIVSMKFHLIFDVFLGLILAASPWALEFSDYVYLPHVIMGLAEVGVAIITKPVPAYLKNERPADPQIAEKNII